MSIPEFTEPTDTVRAKIIPIDLLSLIQPVKEAQFARFGRHFTYGYEGAMDALKKGSVLTTLEQSRTAREVIRALLSVSSPKRIQGKDPGVSQYAATRFLTVPDTLVREALNKIYSEGLLEIMHFGCGDTGVWYLQSERVFPDDCHIRFEENIGLREGLTKLLIPFSSERPLYTHYRSSLDKR